MPARSQRFQGHSSLCSSAMTKPGDEAPAFRHPPTHIATHILVFYHHHHTHSIPSAAHHVPLFTTDYARYLSPPHLFRLVAFSKASDCILAPIPSSSYQESNLLAASPAQKPTALTHPTPAPVCPQSPDGRRGKAREGKARQGKDPSIFEQDTRSAVLVLVARVVGLGSAVPESLLR